MYSNYNNINNNNNGSDSKRQTPKAHSTYYNYHPDMTDNGLHYFFDGLKLLNQTRTSPPSPTKHLLSPQPSPPLESLVLHQPCDVYGVCQAGGRLSTHHSNGPALQKQKNPFPSNVIDKSRTNPLENSYLHRQKTSPPEMVHHKPAINLPSRYHDNNNFNYQHVAHKKQQQPHQQLATADDLLNAIIYEKPRLLAQSSNSVPKNTKPSTASAPTAAAGSIRLPPYDTTSDKHYHHYYSYYYNRQPERSVSLQVPASPAAASDRYTPKNRTIRKLPTHGMASNIASNGLTNGADRRPEDDFHTMPTKKHLPYDPNKYMNGSCDVHVLREKMPNNNNISNLYTKTNSMMGNDDNDDDGNWLDADKDVQVKFRDITSCKVYDSNFQNIFNARYKMRLRAGESFDRSTAAQCYYDAVENAKKNLGVPSNNDNERILPLDGNTQRSPTPKKGEKDEVLLIQKKVISPPAPRVLLYNNNQSPRPSARRGSARMRDIRRSRNKSPFNGNAPNNVSAKSKSLQPADQLKGDLDTNQNNDNNNASNTSKLLAKIDTKTGEKPPKENNGELLKSEVNDNNNYNEKQGSDKNSGDTDSNDDCFDGDVDDVSNFGNSYSDTSSDSENGYRSNAYKLTHSIDKNRINLSEVPSSLDVQPSSEILKNPVSLLVPSLFSNMPPYLAFSSHTTKGPDVPPELFRILKWRITNVMPKVVRSVLLNTGVRLLKNTNDWMGIWGKHLKSPCFKTIRPYQKINHLPGSFKIGRKDSCWKNLQRQMLKHGRKDFGFMPRTFVIPHDLNLLRKSWHKYSQRNVKWIIKPPASARGTGIRVVNRWAQIPKRKPLIVQKYIERPLLINGSKFDLRLYVLVTSINPLRVFLYQNGLARFASVKYSDKSDTLNDRCMHLTNYSINKYSANYAKNEDVNACRGHKWTIKSLWHYLDKRGVRTDLLWEALRGLVLRTILAGENSINNMLKMNVESKYSCYELFGFDVILDADLIPWLLEVNISPSLHSELALDAHVKAPLVQGVLNTALYNVPPKLPLEKQREIAANMSLPSGPLCFDKRLYINYLSRAEKIKHAAFARKEDREEYINAILENLTPDDVRCLIIAEDELARSSPLERIFPTTQTHKYLKFTETPRYYNRLLDAWEQRYAFNRSEGIALLRGFCDSRYHLEVPPAPAKKYFEDDDTTYYLPPEQDDIPRISGLLHQISEMDIKIIIAAIVFVMVASVIILGSISYVVITNSNTYKNLSTR